MIYAPLSLSFRSFIPYDTCMCMNSENHQSDKDPSDSGHLDFVGP